MNVDGHRADLVILKTARAHAAFEGRTAISERDIALAAELALPHRIKRGPFHQAEMTMEDLQERIENLQGGTPGSEDVEPAEGEQPPEKKKP
jgi:Mg-chelatase subunit ChlI